MIIILTAKNGPRVWLWTSSAIKDDTNRLIEICRFIKNRNIPSAEIYFKQEIAEKMSDLYALTTQELNYIVKDEFSIAVLTYGQDKLKETDSGIILIDKENDEHVKLVRDFYSGLKEELRWENKFDRKLKEYLDLGMYAVVRDGKMIANSVIGNRTENYLCIRSIAVLSPERRKGYGYALCAHTVNTIRDRGLTPVLYTHVGNEAAMALWKKADFKVRNKLNLLKIENND